MLPLVHPTLPPDPHAVLGVAPGADLDTIKRAWRQLAKTLHPDVTADDPAALARYHQAQDAYRRLSQRDVHTLQQRAHDAASDIARTRLRAHAQRGADIERPLPISLEDWLNGAERSVSVYKDRKVLIRIQPHWPAGHVLRLRGMGEPGRRGGAAGDVLLTLRPLPHTHFRIDGHDLHGLLPVSMTDMAPGTTLHVQSPRGLKQVKLPTAARAGSRIRLKGQGLPTPDGDVGDLYMTLKVVAVERTAFSETLGRFWQSWGHKSADDLRKGFDRVA